MAEQKNKKITSKIEESPLSSLESEKIVKKVMEKMAAEQEKSGEKEIGPESKEKLEQEISEGKNSNKEMAKTGTVALPQEKEESLRQIEKILEEDLGEIYFNLPLEKQAEFKRVGEETSRIINELLKKTTLKIKEIIKLIISWLKIIPGVNIFFLEQEAKIKADKIFKLKTS